MATYLVWNYVSRIILVELGLGEGLEALVLMHHKVPSLSLLQRFKSSVYRRYNDFVVFYEMLLQKFPYRMVPALPPKRMLGGKVA